MERSVKGPERLNQNHCGIQEPYFWVYIKGDEIVCQRDTMLIATLLAIANIIEPP